MTEIRNPQHEPGAEKRSIIVFAAIMVILLGAQFFIGKFAPQRPAAPPPTSSPAPETKSQPSPAQTTAPANAAPTSATKQLDTKKPATPAAPVATKQADAETETVIENDQVKIVFTNKGAQVKHWILKNQLSDDRKSQLDMVNQRAAEKQGYPLSFFTWDEELGKKLNGSLYVASATGDVKAPTAVSFEYSDGSVVAKKTISVESGYLVKLTTEVTVNGQQVQAFPQWPTGLGDQLTGPGYASTRIDWQTPDKTERHAAHEGFIFKGHISNGQNINGPFRWAATVDQFFAAVFLPDQPKSVKMVQLHQTIPRDPNADEEKQKKETYSILGVAVGNVNGPTSMRLFVGPKDLDNLQRIHSIDENGQTDGDISGVVDFGTFAIIAKPLFLWLKWTHQHWVPNWGWAIILVTIIINVALFPLRYTSMKSALLQQKIKPEVDAISRRYQGIKITDPRQQEKQREIQALQKREGIHPMSGCLPTLIQLPFLWAFYTMLGAVNELRHAPWLWVHDLSAPDPIYMIPLLIVVTMYLSQKITPMPQMDAAQAKMMMVMMPIMMGFISLNLPSGLGVYWFSGNIINMGTQYLMNNSKQAREIREHLAKRDARKGKK